MQHNHTIYTICGHSVWQAWLSADGSDNLRIDDYCHACKQDLIGRRVRFVRFGAMPVSGRSKNYQTGQLENGISVYVANQQPRSEFSDRKTVITGSAIVVGIGSDEEILIDMDTIQ